MAKIVTFGELMLRLQPYNYERFVQATSIVGTPLPGCPSDAPKYSRTPGDGCPYRGIDTSRPNQKDQVKIIAVIARAKGPWQSVLLPVPPGPGDAVHRRGYGLPEGELPVGQEKPPWGASAYGLLAMTKKIEPGSSDYGAARTPREGCPYGYALPGRFSTARPASPARPRRPRRSGCFRRFLRCSCG